MTIMLGLAGRKGSGKSTLGQALSKAFGWPLARFGRYVEGTAIRMGLPVTTRSLQALGQRLVEEDCEGFCRSVLNEAGWSPSTSVVIEGVRHSCVRETLLSIAARSRFVLIYVDVSEKSLLMRLNRRERTDAAQLRSIESHATETDVKTRLRDVADIVVNGDLPTDRLVADIAKQLRDRFGQEI